MEQPFTIRVHWRMGPPAEGPLEFAGAVSMLEHSSAKLPIPYAPEMRQSRDAIRILLIGLLGKALEETPDHVWLVTSPQGSSWAIPGRAVLAVEVQDPALEPTSEPTQVGFVPPTNID